MVEHNNFLIGTFTDADAEIAQLRKDAYLLNGTNIITAPFEAGAQTLFDVADISLNHQATGTTPPVGKLSLYSKSDDLVYIKDSSGVEIVLSTGSASGDVTAAANFGTDNLLIRSDGILKGVQVSGITIDDDDEITGVSQIRLIIPTILMRTTYGYDNLGGVESTFIGYEAGQSNTAIACVGVGYRAGQCPSGGSDNNVGIGNFTIAEATTGTFNIAVGNLALQKISTGASNVGIGHQAAGKLTTGSTVTAVGYLALSETLTTSDNTAVGASAGRDNISVGNVFVGSQAGTGNAAGSFSVYIGNLCGDGGGGSQNVFVGRASGRSVTGSFNTALGTGALTAASGGSSNVAVGQQAMSASIGGGSNVAIGPFALQNCKNNQNIAIGSSALSAYNATSPSTGENISIGHLSLNSLTTVGSGNIAIGHLSGNSLTSGSDNIYIDNDDAVTESNTIRIGNSTDHNLTYLAGVATVVPSLAATAVEDVHMDSAGQLGSASLTSSSTGLVTGGVLSINADPTLFDITDGYGFVFDSDTLIKQRVSWTGLTAQSSGAHVGDITHVSINASGVPFYSIPAFTNIQKRNNIILGLLLHPGASASFLIASSIPLQIHSPVNQISDFAVLVGLAKFSGMIGGSNGLLTILSTSGVMFNYGGNYNTNHKNPNFVDIPFVDTFGADTYNRVLLDDSFTPSLKDINTTQYDVAGVLTNIPGANDFQTMRIYQTRNGTLLVQPGQFIYNSMAQALSAINTDGFIVAPSMVENGLLIAYLTVKDGTTDLAVITDAVFTQAGKFQSTSGGSSAGGNVFNDLSSTDNAIARFDGISGKLIQNSTVTISNGGEISTPTNIVINTQDSILNTKYGYNNLNSITTGAFNTAVGSDSLSSITTGEHNTTLGFMAGSSLITGDSDNVYVGNIGNAGESNAIRIGTSFLINTCNISGITGVTPSGILQNVVINSSGDLGAATTTASSAFPPDYIDGLIVSNAGSDTKNISSGFCRDSTDTYNITYAGATIDILTSGAGGLDTGSPSASTWYYIYIISNNDSSTVDSLISLSATSPTLPGSFTIFRMIMPIRYNSSSDFYSFHVIGVSRDRWVYYEEVDATLRVLTAGSAIVYTNVSCAVLMPPESTFMEFNLVHQATGANDFACLFNGLTGSNTAASPRVIKAYGGTSSSQGTGNVIGRIQTDSSQIINYGNSSAGESSDLFVIAFLIEL